MIFESLGTNSTNGNSSRINDVRCRVDRNPLRREENDQIDLKRLRDLLKRHYELVVLVNPNSPTGQHLPKQALEHILRRAPVATRIWIDETYIEYAGADQSLEAFAATSPNVFVCKSMSKVYALSGLRVAYLCGPGSAIKELRSITPPWAVSLPAQIAAVAALQDAAYYSARQVETHQLRGRLSSALRAVTNWEILPGIANFVLCHLPREGPHRAENSGSLPGTWDVPSRCRSNGPASWNACIANRC